MKSCRINPCANGSLLYRSRCAFCLPANLLGIVYRAIATHLIRKAGYTKATARTGAVTLIQCFGGALNAHIPQGTFS